MNGGFDWSSSCGNASDRFTADPICGSQINGDVTIRDNNTEQWFVGDPGDLFFANGDCAGNTIHGSVFMTNSNFARRTDGEPSEIEGNTVTGSVNVDHSTAEVYGEHGRRQPAVHERLGHVSRAARRPERNDEHGQRHEHLLLRTSGGRWRASRLAFFFIFVGPLS